MLISYHPSISFIGHCLLFTARLLSLIIFLADYLLVCVINYLYTFLLCFYHLVGIGCDARTGCSWENNYIVQAAYRRSSVHSSYYWYAVAINSRSQLCGTLTLKMFCWSFSSESSFIDIVLDLTIFFFLITCRLMNLKFQLTAI